MRFLVAVAIILGAFFLPAGMAQDENQVPEAQSCEAAATWHLIAALKWSDRSDQAYHLGAADAAERLEQRGDASCGGWMDDAQGPHVMPDGTQMGSSAMVES